MTASRTKPEAHVLLNPTGTQIGSANAIIWGRAKRYHVAGFPGPLSIKSVVRGSGVWGTAEAEQVVDSGSYLVLNAARPYSLTIDAREIVETFCLFFRPGFVEDVHRVEDGDPVALLDEPFAAEPVEEKSTAANGNARLQVEFLETLHEHDALVSPLLKRMYARVSKGTTTQEWLEDQFFCCCAGDAQSSWAVGKTGGADSGEEIIDAAGAVQAPVTREGLPRFLPR